MNRTPRSSLALAAVVLVLTGLAACAPGSASDPGDAPEAPTVDDVVGVWGTPGVRGEPAMELEADGNFGGHDGCNSIGGTWQLDEEGIVRFGPIHATMMACEGVDEWLLKAASAELQGDSLVFSDRSGDEIGSLARG